MTGLSCSICRGTGRCRSCDGTGINNVTLRDFIPSWIARFFGSRKVLVGGEHMVSELFPPNFPPELAAEAFVATNEAAWPPTSAAAVVDWFSAHGYAVLGTELWLLQDAGIQSLPIGLSGMREVHGNTVNRESEEAWTSFVARAGAETRAYLQAFKPSDIVERGQLFFNITWISGADFGLLHLRVR
jgi:hypothetical protein